MDKILVMIPCWARQGLPMGVKIIRCFGIRIWEKRSAFLMRWLPLLLLGALTPSTPAVAELPLPDDFSYAVRIQLPLREKSYVGSGFYFVEGESIYLVTARHVLFAPTQVRIRDGARFAIPRHLLHRIRFHKASRLLTLEGVLTSKERDEMLKHPSINESGRQTIQDLFDRSQKLSLKAHQATVVTCEPGVGELDLRLTAMSIKGLVRYHPIQDVAVVKLGGLTSFASEVQVKNPEKTTALRAIDLKSMGDLASGSQILVLGFTYPGKQETSLKVRRPILTRGTVGGINKSLGLIALDCVANPGDSGGLVLQEIDGGLDGKRLRGVGLISGGFRYEKEGRNSKSYALAIPLDALFEVLNQ